MAVSDEYEAICKPNRLLAEYVVVVIYFAPEKSVRSDVQWLLFDASKDRYCKAMVANPDNSEGEEESTYSCNALLGNRGRCGGAGDQMVCGYRRRLLLELIPQFSLQQKKLEDMGTAKGLYKLWCKDSG